MNQSNVCETGSGSPVAASGSESPGRLILQETPRGAIELPTDVYLQIESRLPACLRRGDDDGARTPHFPRLLLRQETLDSTILQKRNVHVIMALLNLAGIPFEFRTRFESNDCAELIDRRAALLAITKRYRSDLDFLDDDGWGSIRSVRYGQLVATDERQMFNLTAALCLAFPRAPVVLVVANADEVHQVARELELRLQEPVHRAFGIHSGPCCRITVATYVAFGSEDLRDAPFVIVPNWRPNYPRWMRLITWGPYRDRIYFLRTQDEPLSAVAADGLNGRLGPVWSGLAKRAAVHRFSTLKYGGEQQEPHPRVAGDRRAIDKRNLYWRHQRRNQAIAGLAAAIATESDSTAILVENLEHAEWLVALLPGWPIVRRSTRPATFPQRCIVTLPSVDRWPAFRPQQLVFAAGGGPSGWLQGWLADMTDDGHDVRLFDLTDAFNTTAATLARARTAAYRRAGCHWRPLKNATIKAIGRNLRLAQRAERRSPTER